MPKGLLALPLIPKAVDYASVASFLALHPENGSETFYHGIEKVPPGHVLRISAERIGFEKFWQPCLDPLLLPREEDYHEAVREALDRAVSARLRGVEGAVGTHLSGGLDSSAVTATAARLAESVVAFTSVPRHGFASTTSSELILDEGPLAAATATLYPNIKHVLLETEGKSPIDELERSFFLLDRPFLNLSNASWWNGINDTARREGISVMLTGSMGNLSFSYSGMEALPQLLRGGEFALASRLGRDLLSNGFPFVAMAGCLLGPFMPEWLWRPVLRAKRRGADPLRSRLLRPGTPSLTRAQRRTAKGDEKRPSSNSMITRLRALSRADPGNYNKGTLGGWGIDVRDPTADQRLVEFCLRIPPHLYLNGGIPRAVARRALTDRLPAAVLGERRRGYQAADWYEAFREHRLQIREEVQRIVACTSASTALDTERMQRLLDHWPQSGWTDAKTTQAYRYALLRAISAGHFIRRVTGSNG
jgi:asparagine synthase (glutamine-hydrolysing)